ncbi:olfactory receptor 4D1-like [Macrochelys suwanniensis]
MEQENLTTTVTEFVLLGLTQTPERRTIFFNKCSLQMFFFHFITSAMVGVLMIGLILQLPFCGPNMLDNFYCDVPQVIKLACRDINLVELLMVSNGGVLVIIIFILLLISYTVLLVKIRTNVTEGKRKALSTCVAQVLVVSLIFIPCFFIYARPNLSAPPCRVLEPRLLPEPRHLHRN